MAVSLVAVTTGSGTSAVDAGIPAGATTGDLLVLSANTSPFAGKPAAPSGDWTEIDDIYCSLAVDYAHVRNTAYYAWYSESLATQVAAIPGGYQLLVGISAWRGVDSTTPLDATTTTSLDDAGSSTVTAASITTVTDGAMIVALCNGSANVTHSGWANAGLESVTEIYDHGTGAAGDGCISGAYGIKTTAGASGATTGTQSAGSHNANFTIALRPYVEPGPDVSEAADLHGDALFAWLHANETVTSGEIVGALNDLNSTSGIGYAEARDTYLNS